MRVYVKMGGASGTGKGFFFERLILAMKREGVTIVTDSSCSHDISLQAVIQYITNAKKYVLRLDGVWHNTEINFLRDNGPIQNSLTKTDGVVYQSKFSKLMCDKYLGVSSKPNVTISNGAEIVNHNKSINTKVVLTASRWRPHKRLTDIIESFLLAKIDGSVLYVAGDLKLSGIKAAKMLEYSNNSNIVFLGHLSQEILRTYLKAADVFLHLSWIDWCPNSVVEAIALGIPVITNNVGGTCELVEPSGGFVLSLDSVYDMKPCKLYDPPPIDRTIVAAAIQKCCSEIVNIDSNHVNIDNIAKQYIDFFRSLL